MSGVENVKLLPCPFCGGEAVIDQGHDGWVVACENKPCEVQPEGWFHKAKDAAITAWNTRADQVAELAWQPIETAPYAQHVLAGRFDDGDWVASVVLSPPSQPFTHWTPLHPAPAGEA